MHPVNTFVPDFEYASDKSHRNTGGLNRTDTLIEQGDYPVDVVELEQADAMMMQMQSDHPEILHMHMESRYVTPKRCGGDIDEGVSFCRPMFNDMIKKNSDY